MLIATEDEFLASVRRELPVDFKFTKDVVNFTETVMDKLSMLKSSTVKKHAHKYNVLLTSIEVFVYEPESTRKELRKELIENAVHCLVNFELNRLQPSKGATKVSWAQLDSASASLHKLLIDDVYLKDTDKSSEDYCFRKKVARSMAEYQKRELESVTSSDVIFIHTYNRLQQESYLHIADIYQGLERGIPRTKELESIVNDLMSRCNGIRINSNALKSAEKKYAKSLVEGDGIFESQELLSRKIRICFNITNEISDLLEDATNLLDDNGLDFHCDSLEGVGSGVGGERVG